MKKGTTAVNVQWESDGSVSDVAIENLEHIEQIPFNNNKFSGLTLYLFYQVARLTEITNELNFPLYDFTSDEEKLLDEERRTSYDPCRSSLDPQLLTNQFSGMNRQASPRTIDSLSDEIVTTILVEGKRISVEKIVGTQSETTLLESNKFGYKLENNKLKQLKKKLLNLEGNFLKIAFLQFAALKTLGIFLTSNLLTELLLAETTSHDTLKKIMLALVDKSINKCKLHSIVTFAEFERAESIMHLNFVKAAIYERLTRSMASSEDSEAGQLDEARKPPAPRSKQHNNDVLPASRSRQHNNDVLPTLRDVFSESDNEECTLRKPFSPIVGYLQEMGFSVSHILTAMRETRNSGENVHLANSLAIWMLEHPPVDSPEEDTPQTSSRQSSRNLQDNFEWVEISRDELRSRNTTAESAEFIDFETITTNRASRRWREHDLQDEEESGESLSTFDLQSNTGFVNVCI